MLKRALVLFLIAMMTTALLFPSAGFSVPVSAETGTENASAGAGAQEADNNGSVAVKETSQEDKTADGVSYSDYTASHTGYGFAADKRILEPGSPVSTVSAQVNQQDNTVTFSNEGSTALWEFQVERAGLYGVWLAYIPMQSSYDNAEVSLKLDGVLPFQEANSFEVKIPWALDAIQKDDRGNDIMPDQSIRQGLTSQWLYARGGTYAQPVVLALDAGAHKLELCSNKAPFVLKQLVLSAPEASSSYAEYRNKTGGQPDKAANSVRILDGEKPTLRSDASILPKYDIQNASTQPSNPGKMLLNALDSTNWTQAGQWVEWNFDIENSGYYALDIKAMQNVKSGMYVYRRVLIDGKLPFHELDSVTFQYSNNWMMNTLGGNEPNWFYFEKGQHTLRLQVVLGEYGDFIEKMYQQILNLNEIYRNVIMVTGTNPDRFRDYDLQALIPNLQDDLKETVQSLTGLYQQITESFASGVDASTLNNTLVQLRQFQKNTGLIPENITSFNSNITSLSAWVLNLQAQPLSVDYIKLRGKNVEPDKATVGFFQSSYYTLANILATFQADYGMTGQLKKGNDALTVWVGSGRDQAQLLKRMAENAYMSGRVNISLVQSGLLEAVMAHRGPDVFLFASASEPVNYASRGALTDLTKFSDFSQISQRFNKESLVPFAYQNGIFALPLTQNFTTMFYRTDIFKELGISYPTTWDELFRIIPVIQGQNMNVGLPEDIFATLLYQNSGSYYNKDYSASALDTPEAIKAFTTWTEFYTVYDLPVSFSLFNRFRSGEMPLGIAPYTLYTQLESAAPEITGLWEMVPLPATVLEDGTKVDTVAGTSSETAIILASSDQQKDAWEFVKWAASTETQIEFGNQIEARLGPIARYATANRDALASLPWSAKQKKMLLSQLDSLKTVPHTPATYYVTRQLNNAFRKVIYDGENARHTLYQYNSLINKEIERKNNQLKNYVK